MDSDSNAQRLHRELDKFETIQQPRLAHLFCWDRRNETVTVFPRKANYLAAYSLGVLCILLSLVLLGWILGDSSLTDDAPIVIWVLLSAVFFLSLGIYTFTAAKRSSFIILDLRHKTVHLEKIGVFEKHAIAGITICANPWTERFRSKFAACILRDETLLEDENFVKNVTIGVRFDKSFFLGFKTIPIINYRHFRDAKSFQYALANFYDCQRIDITNPNKIIFMR